MKKDKRFQSQDGAITVFLSLVLLLILSLVMIVIEGARQTTARVIAERALITSMDSVLAGFYGPLMEEYKILGLDIPYEDASHKEEEITQKMIDYMSYTLNPSREIYEAGNRGNLYGTSIERVKLLNDTSLVDYQGKVFIHEVTEYMKYRSVGNLIDLLLDKASLLEQPKKVSYLYEEKLSLEEKLVTIDEGILALMKYIDGISTGRKGLLRGRGGSLKTERYFSKKILYKIPTMESTGINNELVFLALEDEYIDPTEMFTIIDLNLERLDKILRNISLLESRLDGVNEAKYQARKTLQSLKESLSESKDQDKSYTEGIKAAIHGVEASISELENQENTIRASINEHKNEQINCINTVTIYSNKISELVSGSLTATQQAIIELDHIIIAAQESEPLIKSYEENLNKEKEGLDEDIYDNLEEGLEELKRYQIGNSYGYDFIRMKEVLTKNCKLLISCQNSLDNGYEAIISQDFIRAKEIYSRPCRELLAYNTENLNLNYSTLLLENKDSPDYIDGIKDLIEEGIMGLVIDPDTISKDEIYNEMLPSIIYELSKKEEVFSFSKLLKKMIIGGKDSNLGGLFGGFGDYSMVSLVGSGVDEILKRVLIQMYIDEHFNEFPVNNEKKEERKPSVLTYEWEYLLYGKTSDKDNLEAAIGRLLLIRTLLNFTTILGDKAKWSEAKSIATYLVGFTGLPILVAITQGILMILLALACGLVDTCALLMGKEIAILKKGVALEYSDLLILTRENIQKKADSYRDEEGFSYKNYLTLFMLLTNQKKLSYRMMDLIQENIKIRYGTDFNIQRCIFGYEVEASFQVEPLFTSLSFVQRHINSNINKAFRVRAEYSY